MKVPIKKLLHAMTRRFGVDFMRYSAANNADLRRAKILADFGVNLVIDVGANVGGYGAELRRTGYTGSLLSIEPLQAAFDQLSQCASSDPRWKCVRSAVGAERGQIVMHVSGRLSSSSILAMTPAHWKAAGASQYVAAETVPITTLDEIATGELRPGSIAYIKADVQGYEKIVLQSGLKVIRQAVAVEVELSTISLYEGSPLLPEMVKILEELDLILVSMEPVLVDERTSCVLQFNGIFIKRGSFEKTDVASPC